MYYYSHNLGCDLKSELVVLKDAMYKTFIVEKQRTIYNPQEFKKFCFSSGAPGVFHTILATVTSSHHSRNEWS